MGLDMYLYKVKKITDEKAASLNLCNTENLDEKGYITLSSDNSEMFSSILEYGKKIIVKETNVDLRKVKKDHGIPKNAEIVGYCFSHKEISYTFKWNEIKQVKIPIICNSEIDVDGIKTEYNIPDDFKFERQRKYKGNTILSYSRHSKETVRLTQTEYESYLYEAEAEVWVFKMSEVGYWRKAYDLQNKIHEEFNGQVENCGYYKCHPSTMLKINFYQTDHDLNVFEPLSDDECYVYHEWY